MVSLKVKIIITVIFCTLISISCGKLEGEFAFKSFHDSMYMKKSDGAEFPAGEKIKWIFKLKDSSGHRKIGVLIMKKEMIWVEIKTRSDYIDKEKSIIYGTFDGLPSGKFQIILTDVKRNNSKISKFNFTLYTPDEK
ncbi:hypothetical protein ACFL20_01490 [Spirochaetota bacterium]